MPEIIVAFDHATSREALDLADRLPGLAWAKVGPVLYVREGPAIVRELARRGARIFLDLKWHDIPSTVAGAVTAARDVGVDLATVHCVGGAAMLEAASRAAGAMALVGVTVLTSHDAAAWSRIVGCPVDDVGPEVERLAQLAAGAGLKGVVASGGEVSRLRRLLGPDAWIIVPGVRLPGDPVADQARTVTPAEAGRLGATHIVVGRSITRAPDPALAYREIQQCV